MKRETKDNILMSIIGIGFFLNISLPLLLDIVPIIDELVVVGWVILSIGVLFVFLSIFTLHREGTSNIIDSGIYSIVRHPMYLGGMVMFFSHIFFFQNWITVTNAIVGIVCCYLIIRSADQRNIEKFDDNYERYMQKVPRINFLLGIVRLLRYRKK